MFPLRLPIVLFGAVLAAAAGAGNASTCYVILDAKETMIYRDATPPVDMSSRGAAARDELRKKGNYLLIMEAEKCVPVGFESGWASSAQARAPDFLSNVRSFGRADDGAVARAPGIAVAKPTTATPAPATVPAAPSRSPARY